MTTTAELLRAFHSMDSSRKARPLRIVEEKLLPREEEETEQVAAESV
jgi:hypothetical protein